MSDQTPLKKRLAEIDQETYDRLRNWASREGLLLLNKRARRDARHVCALLSARTAALAEETRLADSAFGKAEQYVQAANVSGRIIEANQKRIAELEALLREVEERLTYADDSSRYIVGVAALVERIRATLPATS